MTKHFATSAIGVIWLGVNAMAWAASPAAAPSSKRQLIDCMNKQMAASRTLSYNDASKSCKDLLKAHGDALVSANEARPGIAR